MESSQSQRRGLVTLSPSQTPRSADKIARDLRLGESISINRQEKDRGVNVQVLLRCRPLSEDELKVNTPVVITCNENRKEVSAAQNIANKQIDRTFMFDKVFGPASQQKDLYVQAVSPIVNEVLEGYNCTIFAYGQTGTGKTYTMEGGARKKNGEFPVDAGVIPRAVQQIFDILEFQNAEYSMKVTFLELYNEEITDLLATEECFKYADDKWKKPIALMEDGKGGVFVRGLEEEIVTTANEIYKILERGSSKRRTAETLLNKQSSRSHSIFSITIHIKECTPEGEEMIKCGKLNLVDLAGSENISRSGARESRAREAGEINKSLLTLGRVINALVEHSCHVPYRDSKLTRLLRESLGGKTKTCIIATISPSIHSLEETLSTLDYAHRAKNIKNKPEINQKMMKSAMIKDLYSEIDRLKQEVYAAREKNGIYIPRDRFSQDEAEKKTMSEKIERMELESDSKNKQLMDLRDIYNGQVTLAEELNAKLEKTEKKLEETENSLSDLEEKQRQAHAVIKEKEYFISNLLKSEKALLGRALGLRQELDNAVSDISSLFSKLEQKHKIENENKALIEKFRMQLIQQLDALHATVSVSMTQQERCLEDMETHMQSFISTKGETTGELHTLLHELKMKCSTGFESLSSLSKEFDILFHSTLANLGLAVSTHSSELQNLFKETVSEADHFLHELQNDHLSSQQQKLDTFVQHQHAAHLSTIEASRSISRTAFDFFDGLDSHAIKLDRIVDDARVLHDQKSLEFEKKFEECVADEEKQMLQKVAELFAASHSRKRKLVETAVRELRETASCNTGEVRAELASMQRSTSCVRTEWASYSDRSEKRYASNTSAADHAKFAMDRVLQICGEKVRESGKKWRNAEESMRNLAERNGESVSSIVSAGMDAGRSYGVGFSSAVASALRNAEIAQKTISVSIDDSLNLDRGVRECLDSMIEPCCESLRQLQSGHRLQISSINDDAAGCLCHDYKVDETASSSMPPKRVIDVPSVASIEELRTPTSPDELSRSSLKLLSNGDVAKGVVYDNGQALLPRDPRLPLTTIN